MSKTSVSQLSRRFSKVLIYHQLPQHKPPNTHKYKILLLLHVSKNGHTKVTLSLRVNWRRSQKITQLVLNRHHY